MTGAYSLLSLSSAVLVVLGGRLSILTISTLTASWNDLLLHTHSVIVLVRQQDNSNI